MEYGLWPWFQQTDVKLLSVLILVVMEYGLWQNSTLVVFVVHTLSLNPCCNGIWSLTTIAEKATVLKPGVLILVVMEYDSWQFLPKWKLSFFVLILVVMEYGLWHNVWQPRIQEFSSLNPCCKWNMVSDSVTNDSYNGLQYLVLILVVMEYGLDT